MIAFAVLGSMWSAIDLHQHEDGLYQLAQCVTCSLEESVAHGFTLHATIQAITPPHDTSKVVWLADNAVYACVQLVSIRAPPFA